MRNAISGKWGSVGIRLGIIRLGLSVGGTDRFKGQFPAWIGKTKRRPSTNPVTKNLGGKKRSKDRTGEKEKAN